MRLSTYAMMALAAPEGKMEVVQRMSGWHIWDIESYSSLTANRIVAYNLVKARELRGWTQEEAGGELEQHLGVPWSAASVSAAECSVDSERIKQFSADEILAFAKTFNLPVMWFFLPPDFGLTNKPRQEEEDVSSYLSGVLGGVSYTQEMEKRLARIYNRLPEFRPEHEVQSASLEHGGPILKTSELLRELESQRDRVSALVDRIASAEKAGQRRLRRTKKRKKST